MCFEHERMRRRTRITSAAAAAIALACFGAALAFPAIGTCYGGSSCEIPNWFENQNILLFGWMAIFAGQIGWFANIPMVLNIRTLFSGHVPSFWLVGSEAALLATAVFTLQPSFGLRLPHNEGYDEAVSYLGRGFWLWVVAHAVVVVAAVVLRLSTRQRVGDGN